MKILITGSEGFIGSHLTEKLIKLGYDVRCFVLYNSFNSWGWLDGLPKNIHQSLDIFTGDIRDPFAVKKAMDGCNAVIHLAALIGIPYSYVSPKSYIDTNITGTLNLLKAATELSIDKFIHTSTSEVYGTAKYVPINEDHPLQAQSPYSASKIAADQLVYSFFSSFNLPAIIARPFNTFGPRQSARALIPTVISQILSSEKKIKIGSTHPTRDFNYVSDTVDAFIKILNTKIDYCEVINIGNNFEISIYETIKLISELMNVEINIQKDKKRVRPKISEVNRLWCDNSKSIKLLKWKPKFNGKEGFKKGLNKTIQWYSDPKNLSFYKSNIYNL